MTSPMVDRVRNIPLIVEREVCDPMVVDECADEDDTGFPFDRDSDRGRGRGDETFRSQLDDLAKRHPEFAEHFGTFPFRSDSSGNRTRPSRAAEDPELRRFTDRPFGSSRFERFGFPFGREFFDDEHQRPEQHHPQQQQQPQEQHQQQHQQQPQHNQQQQQQPEQSTPEQACSNSNAKPPEAPERGRRQNIQQSNTVDLGQRQEPVNERNQRSMSAPPPDSRSGQRFVSSINIPINREGGMGDMGTNHSQPQPQPQQQPQQEKTSSKPVERVIPIHIEGRDEPFMPRHTGPSFGQPQPQPERIFGHRPSQFTQFVNREPPRQFGAVPEWHHPAYEKHFEPTMEDQMRQQQQYQQQQPKFQQQQHQQPQQQKQASPPQQQQQAPPPQQQQQPTQQVPQQPPKSQPPTPIDIIQSIQKDVSELMGQVEQFSGLPRDKQYLYLDEMLTRNLIKLDNVDTQGQENIRQARKEAIKCIEKCIGVLEAKAAANVPRQKQEEPPQQQQMEVAETKAEEPQQLVEANMEEQLQQTSLPVEANTEAQQPEQDQPPQQAEVVVEAKKEEEKKPEEIMEVVPENVETPKVDGEQKPSENVQTDNPMPPAEEKSAESPPVAGDKEEIKEENKNEGDVKEDANQAETKEDKKEKKKGKKKVVKK